MTTGNVGANNSTAGSGTWTIQPASGAAYVIHNIVVSGAAKFQAYDGTNTVVFDTAAGAYWWADVHINITNGCYLQVVDTSGSTNLMHYDGYEVA